MSTPVQRFRERRRAGRLLLPRLEIEASVADDLVTAGLLKEWDTEDPQAVAAAVLRLLNHLKSDYQN